MLNCSVFEPIIEHVFYDGAATSRGRFVQYLGRRRRRGGVHVHDAAGPALRDGGLAKYLPADKPKEAWRDSGIRHEGTDTTRGRRPSDACDSPGYSALNSLLPVGDSGLALTAAG